MQDRMEWTELFARMIRQLREDSGLTVAAMAEAFGVDERTYRKYARGESSPPVADFCAALENFHAPILRPVLNYIHPDICSAEDIEIIRQNVALYVLDVAPDRLLRQLQYMLIDQAADNIVPQMELLSLLQHVPLIYRVMVASMSLAIWDLCESRGELVHMDAAPPDIASLRDAVQKADSACRSMREQYTTIDK